MKYFRSETGSVRVSRGSGVTVVAGRRDAGTS